MENGGSSFERRFPLLADSRAAILVRFLDLIGLMGMPVTLKVNGQGQPYASRVLTPLTYGFKFNIPVLFVLDETAANAFWAYAFTCPTNYFAFSTATRSSSTRSAWS